MIFLLLQDRRLRLQLFLGLLLMVCTIPGETEGLKCLKCARNQTEDPTCSDTVSEDCPGGSCFKMAVPFGTIQVVKKECSFELSKKQADCLLRALGTPGKKCYSMKMINNGEDSAPVDKEVADAMYRCESAKRRNLGLGRQGDMPEEVDVVLCHCCTDHCDPDSRSAPAAKVNNPDSGGGGSSSGHTQKEKSSSAQLRQVDFLIPAIVMVFVIYGCIRGMPVF